MIDFAPEVPVACVLGGPGRRVLCIWAAPAWRRDELAGTRAGRIAAIDVAVAGRASRDSPLIGVDRQS